MTSGEEIKEGYKSLHEKGNEEEKKNSQFDSFLKPKPVEKATPERPGEGWQYFYFDPRGSSRVSGLPDSIVKGVTRDTIWHRPYIVPPIPKHEIKPKN